MTKIEIKKHLRGFINEIKVCASQEEAIEIRRRIEDFYNENDVPEEDDILLQSGFCELLAMIAL